jgi:hypothetical protein
LGEIAEALRANLRDLARADARFLRENRRRFAGSVHTFA